MVPLPLFKLAALFVRHISKYGANRIKIQAHDHPRFRAFAAKYGQVIHQLNMRLSVASKRNIEKEIKAKEKAEAPTVKTKEQVDKEEAAKAAGADSTPESKKSVWRRKFRPLPEAKAVDLFADVVGDAFILAVAGALIIYEYQRSSTKPDTNAEKIEKLKERVEELQHREEELEEEEKRQASRIRTLEEVLRSYKDPKTKQPLLPPAPAPTPPTPTPTPTSTPPPPPSAPTEVVVQT